jgi:hypothetical protein
MYDAEEQNNHQSLSKYKHLLETHEHHQSALLLLYRNIIFSTAVRIPGTFQGTKYIDIVSVGWFEGNYLLFAFQHCQASDR